MFCCAVGCFQRWLFGQWIKVSIFKNSSPLLSRQICKVTVIKQIWGDLSCVYVLSYVRWCSGWCLLLNVTKVLNNWGQITREQSLWTKASCILDLTALAMSITQKFSSWRAANQANINIRERKRSYSSFCLFVFQKANRTQRLHQGQFKIKRIC